MSFIKPTQMPKFVLVLMIRNEEKILLRCLSAVTDLVSAFCICDTGSTDTSREIAADFLKTHDGCLTTEPWRDFGYNRTVSFKNAQTYLTSVKTIGSQLASCVTQSLTSGALGGDQKSGPTISKCITNFTDAVKRESEAAQSATATYLKGVTSPCKEKVQAFNDDIKALTTMLSKSSGGNGSETASMLIANVGSSEVQAKLASAKTTFDEMTKVCANLAPAGK
jgi:hypothetical protein